VIGTHFTGIVLPEGKARCAPQCRHFKQSACCIRAKESGLRWHETGHRVRCSARLMPGIAPRAAPARMNRFDAMK
jgi:hypothetical protein